MTVGPDVGLSAPDGADDADAGGGADARLARGGYAEDRVVVDSGSVGDADARGDTDTDSAFDAGGDDDDDQADAGGDLGAGGDDDDDQVDAGDDFDADNGGDAGGQPDAHGDADAGGDAGAQPPSDPACLAADPYPSTLVNTSGLNKTKGEIRFVARDGNTLTAYTHRSNQFNPATGQIVFIMHGAGRNADGYLDKWRSEVNNHNMLAIAPEFPKDKYSGSEDYNLGVGTSGTPYTSTYDSHDWRNPEDYTYSEIEHLFEALKTELGNPSCRYLIYGHSAGGQFVHRLLTFLPDARVAKAVAANAGWYTLPSDGGGYDRNFYMPYGLQGAPPDSTRLTKLFARDLVVLLGENDTTRDSYLRTRSQADAQGLNRLERGQFYYTTGQQKALSLGVPFNWTVDVVPGVGHSNGGMTPAAATHLFGP